MINKYINILVKILIYIILIIKCRSLYLNPLYSLIENYYSKKIEIIGKENIPKTNGYIIISNHNFMSEVFLIQSIFKKINVITKKSLNLKFTNINNMAIPYDKTKENIKKSGDIIKTKILKNCKNYKKNILVFPEGNWTNINKMFLFKKGLFYLCYKNNIPIIPIIICIKKKKLKYYTLCFDEKIKVKIFEQVNSKNFDNFDKYYIYIYNLMNDYLIKYINDKNTKISILI